MLAADLENVDPLLLKGIEERAPPTTHELRLPALTHQPFEIIEQLV